MSSQVISYRLNTEEVLALRQKALPGESDNQTAQRLMREVLGVSTVVSTQSTLTLDERIESVVEDRLSSFAANQNELLSRLQERLQQLEAQMAVTALPSDRFPSSPDVDISVDSVNASSTTVDNFVDSVNGGLTQAELAKRLKVDSGTLSKNRSKSSFIDWSRDKDPEGLGWGYLPELKRYTPILSTEPSTKSTENEPDISSWKTRVDAVVGEL
jgi:methyl-accepting chemotaxis protein